MEEQLIAKAREMYGDIQPCWNSEGFDSRSFTQHNGCKIFWFNCQNQTTRILIHDGQQVQQTALIHDLLGGHYE